MAVRARTIEPAPPPAAGIGDNRPPTDDPNEALRLRLQEEHARLADRAAALIAACGRLPEIVDDETAGKVGDFSQKQIADCLKSLEGARVAAKEPFLSAGRTVDGFFKGVADPLERAKRGVDAKRKAYLDAKATRERLAREEAARRAREEEARARAEAMAAEQAARNEAELEAAIERDREAEQARANAEAAARAAVAKPAELSRVRGEYGSVSSLRQFWNFSDLDRDALDLEPLRQHLPMDALEKAVRSAIKAGTRQLRGVRIFEDTRL